MAERPRVLIAGGSGVFGRLLAEELLATTDAEVVLAGRDLARAQAACRDLPHSARARALRLDLRDLERVEEAAREYTVVACAAGPFQDLSLELPGIAMKAGAHWLDIADDPAWVVPLLDDGALDGRARVAGVAVIPGASTLPTVSGALARWCHRRLPGATRARVTLFIGNRNDKGAAAMASALTSGFRDPARVGLPEGTRMAYLLPSPDEVLLLRSLGVEAETRVVLGFGAAFVAAAGPAFRLVPTSARARMPAVLAAVARPLSRLGARGGSIQVELWDEAGRTLGAALADGGQRLAILPCAIAVEALLKGRFEPRGAVELAAWLEPDEWIRRLRARGPRLLVRDTLSSQ